MRSLTFAFTLSVLRGFSLVPGGNFLKWLTLRPSFKVTSTSPLRGAAASTSVRSATRCTRSLYSLNLRVGHALAGVARGKPHRAIHQGEGDDVLAIHVRHGAVVHDIGAIFQQPYDDALHIVHAQVVFAAQREERIKRGLDGIAD